MVPVKEATLGLPFLHTSPTVLAKVYDELICHPTFNIEKVRYHQVGIVGQWFEWTSVFLAEASSSKSHYLLDYVIDG